MAETEQGWRRDFESIDEGSPSAIASGLCLCVCMKPCHSVIQSVT